MSASTDQALRAPFLPLRLAEEHLDAIGALWMERRGLLFRTDRGQREIDKVERRLARQFEALELQVSAARREALLRLHSRAHVQVFAAAAALDRLDRASLLVPSGCLAVRRACSFPIADALRHASALRAEWNTFEDPVLLDAASCIAPAPTGVLLGCLWSDVPELRRSAMLAVGRHPAPPTWALDELRRTVAEATASSTTALYALALAQPRVVGDWLEATVGDAIVDQPGALPLLGVFGSVATARSLARRVTASGATLELVHALGLLGVPAALACLIDVLSSDSPPLRAAAIWALRTAAGDAMGRLETDSKQPRDRAGLGVAFEEWASGAADVRHHLGQPLDGVATSSDAPASLLWLRAVTGRAEGNGRFEIPDWLFGDGYGARSTFGSRLAASSSVRREPRRVLALRQASSTNACHDAAVSKSRLPQPAAPARAAA